MAVGLSLHIFSVGDIVGVAVVFNVVIIIVGFFVSNFIVCFIDVVFFVSTICPFFEPLDIACNDKEC